MTTETEISGYKYISVENIVGYKYVTLEFEKAKITSYELESVLSTAFKKTTSDFEQHCQSVSFSWEEIVTLSK